MKQIVLALWVVIVGWNYSVAQCNPYYNLNKGSVWELTSYDSRGKVTGRQVNTLKSYNETSTGWDASIALQVYDKKDKLVYEKDGVLSCDDGVIKMDMERFIPKESMEAFKDMNMNVEVDNLEWPSTLSIGKSLEDGTINISGGPFNMSIVITDRKVEGREEIDTPVGSFDTFKITYKVKTRMMMNMELQGVDFIAKDVGLVKSESYDKNGKLSGYILLTDYKE